MQPSGCLEDREEAQGTNRNLGFFRHLRISIPEQEMGDHLCRGRGQINVNSWKVQGFGAVQLLSCGAELCTQRSCVPGAHVWGCALPSGVCVALQAPIALCKTKKLNNGCGICHQFLWGRGSGAGLTSIAFKTVGTMLLVSLVTTRTADLGHSYAWLLSFQGSSFH